MSAQAEARTAAEWAAEAAHTLAAEAASAGRTSLEEEESAGRRSAAAEGARMSAGAAAEERHILPAAEAAARSRFAEAAVEPAVELAVGPAAEAPDTGADALLQPPLCVRHRLGTLNRKGALRARIVDKSR